MSYTVREAHTEEADLLSELAMRSKAHWGYSRGFLDACRIELTVDRDRIGSDEYHCFVAIDETEILGFYTIENVSASVSELEALFVEPAHIGTGIGRFLVQHAIQTLSERKVARLIIQGDPHATDFYLAAGAREIGHRESASIPGRTLPLFEIDIG